MELAARFDAGAPIRSGSSAMPSYTSNRDRLAARDRGGRLQSHPPAVPRLPGTAELAKWRDATHPPGLQFFDVGRGASDHEFVGDAAVQPDLHDLRGGHSEISRREVGVVVHRREEPLAPDRHPASTETSADF